MRDDPGFATADPRTFFSGGGQVGAIMRAKDWSATPLGPVTTWPQSLRTSVSVMLTSPQPSYLFWGPELAILYNDRGLPFVGQKHPECLGHSIRDVLKEAWPVLGPLVEGVMATGEPVFLENLLIPLDRAGFVQDGYFTFSYIAVRNEAAEVGGILVIVNETTGQVLGERRLAVIREMSLRAALAQTVDEALHVTEEVLSASPGELPFSLLYEVRSDDVRLVFCTGLERDEPGAAGSERDAKAWPIDDVVRSGQESLVEDLRVRFALPGGPSGETARQALLLPLRTERGDTTHVLVAGLNPRFVLDDDARSFLQLLTRQISTSIASTRAIEEKSERAAQLAALDRQKTEFFSNVSHEFRTPLTLMLGPLQDALDGGQALGADALGSVHRNALRLLKLVNNLLEFSRVEAGRQRALHRAVDLAQLTTDVASGFRSLVESAGLEFNLEVPASSEPSYVDPDMWEKIVLNLISNAVKFTFEGQIVIRLSRHDTHHVLSVTDTGVGIAEEELPRLFERFHRVEGARSRTHEGTGIGLALVAEMAKLHGGSVEAKSTIGHGSTFSVTLPHAPAGVVKVATPASPRATLTTQAYIQEASRWNVPRDEASQPALSSTAPDDARRRVLVVDDNADMRDYLVRLLSERWDVEMAFDGATGLEMATTLPPDVIVSDLMMPGLDGLGFVRALRAEERTREIPFILLSARADRQSTTEALALGATDYIVKPFNARELLARVGAQLDIVAIQRAARARLERYAYTVSHDLKASLRGIGIIAGWLEEDFEDVSAIAREHIALLKRRVAQMQAFIEGILQYAVAGEASEERRTVDVHELIETVVDMLVVREAQTIEIVDPMPVLHTSYAALQQVFLNLIGNALKHSKRDEPHVTVRAEDHGDHYTFFVADNGVGIAPRDQLRVWDLFQSITPHTTKGHGIGLSIVRKTVEWRGGTVALESDVDKGAVFSFTWPKRERAGR